MSRYLTSQQVDYAVEEYLTNNMVSASSLAVKLGCSAAAVAKHLRKRILPEQYQQLKLLRNPTHPGEEIVEAKRAAVKERRRRAASRVNHEAFAGSLTTAKAYWLGFMMADGCVTGSHGTRICLSLAERDRRHVEKFRKFVAGEHYDIKYVKSNNSCSVRFTSSPMASDLDKYGIVPRKSLTDGFAVNVPDELLSHYMRGLFDGDGSVHADEYGQPVVQIVGGKEFNRRLLDILQKQGLHGLGPYRSAIRKQTGKRARSTTALFQNGNARQMLEWIYTDSTESIRLSRKWNKWKTIAKRGKGGPLDETSNNN